MVAVADPGGGISSVSGECFSLPSYHLPGADKSDRRSSDYEEIEMETKVKEERVEILDGGGGGGCPAARPMEGLQEAATPPFLKKTFEMVEDPETDSVVSWSEGRESFVVWDSPELARSILPRNFKHSNFSSFVRQLNTYGFRKVDPDRWEFANEGFQGGKKHLLGTIKRRIKPSPDPNPRPGLESDIDALKTDQNRIESELRSLVRRQQEAEQRLTAVEDRIRFSETRQIQTLRFLVKSVTDPSFLRNLIRKRELEDGAGDRKRRRAILSAAETGDSLGSGDSEVFSVGDFVSESVLDDICVDFDDELTANDPQVYHDWDGFMTGLVDQTGQCSELMLG